MKILQMKTQTKIARFEKLLNSVNVVKTDPSHISELIFENIKIWTKFSNVEFARDEVDDVEF